MQMSVNGITWAGWGAGTLKIPVLHVPDFISHALQSLIATAEGVSPFGALTTAYVCRGIVRASYSTNLQRTTL